MKQEKIVQTKICKHCNSNFEITDKDIEFYDKISPTFNWKKFQIPPPTLCPLCRQQRRLVERNAKKLYKRVCDATGKPIISMYSPDKPYKVYNQDFWWTDNWNPMDYSMDFDFSKSFFEQFKILKNKTPAFSLFTWWMMENSEYTNCTWYLKNCYLISESDYDEDCYYSNLLKNSNNLVDCSIWYNNEHCYECIDCISSFNLKYSQNSENCLDSFFLKDCIWCKNCIWCINQKNKQYMIFDIQYSKEDYEKKLIDLNLDNYNWILNVKNIFDKNTKKSICKNVYWNWNFDCIWDQIYNSKNANMCFDSKDLEDCKYCLKLSIQVKSCMDYTSWWDKAEQIYYSSACWDGIYNVLFCTTCTTNLSNCFYCEQCSSVKNCFWCFWLRNKEYCILNKQYSKQEYEKLVSEIIEHMVKTWEWGEFFPNDIASFGYNETIAMDFNPLSKEEAIKQNFIWSDYETPFPKVEKIIPAHMLPDNIKDIPDDIINRAIECEITKKPFRIIDQELDFYRKHNLPIPRRHPDQRHLDRMNLRNPRILYDRKCAKCEKDIKTTYAPERSEIVYCEECYNKEVY